MEEIDIILNNPDKEVAYFKLVDLYMRSNEKMRKEMRQDWDYGENWLYPKRYRLACLIGEKYAPKEKITALLLSHTLEDTECTHRHQLMSLGNIYQSCILAGLNPSTIFKTVADMSTPNVAKRLNDFLKRDDENKSLKAFHLVVHECEDGDKELHEKGMF